MLILGMDDPVHSNCVAAKQLGLKGILYLFIFTVFESYLNILLTTQLTLLTGLSAVGIFVNSSQIISKALYAFLNIFCSYATGY